MSDSKKGNKTEKQLAVAIATLEVVEIEGLTGVTHSKVSRRAKISRAWIYEYIGNEKSALIEFAANVFAGYIAREKLMDLPRTKDELQKRLEEGLEFLFASVELSPLMIKLYYRFRGTDNPIGKAIQKHERQWLSSASKTLVQTLSLPREQAEVVAEVVLTLRLGFAHRLVTSEKSEEFREKAKQTFRLLYALFSAAF